MNMTSTCTTCGAEIREGQGRYIIPLGPNVRVQITIIDPEHRLDRYQHTTES